MRLIPMRGQPREFRARTRFERGYSNARSRVPSFGTFLTLNLNLLELADIFVYLVIVEVVVTFTRKKRFIRTAEWKSE